MKWQGQDCRLRACDRDARTQGVHLDLAPESFDIYELFRILKMKSLSFFYFELMSFVGVRPLSPFPGVMDTGFIPSQVCPRAGDDEAMVTAS